jgi:broad specificity phosphatase PhoE
MQNQFQNSIFTRIFLIRHGQTEWNKKKIIQGALDIPLNQDGIQQAEALSKRMNEHYPFDVLFSSPAERALKTAQMINGKSPHEILVDPDLIEVDFGSLTNHTLDNLEFEQAEYIQKFNHFISTNRKTGTIRPELPQGEPISKIEARIHSFIDKILIKYKGQKIAVVSHGSFLKCLITVLSGESLRNYMPYWIENASISMVDFYGHIPIIRVLNDTSHLDQPLDFVVPRIL